MHFLRLIIPLSLALGPSRAFDPAFSLLLSEPDQLLFAREDRKPLASRCKWSTFPTRNAGQGGATKGYHVTLELAEYEFWTNICDDLYRAYLQELVISEDPDAVVMRPEPIDEVRIKRPGGEKDDEYDAIEGVPEPGKVCRIEADVYNLANFLCQVHFTRRDAYLPDCWPE